MRILMCTDGSKHALQAMEYGAIIARGFKSDVTVLGIVEKKNQKESVEKSLEKSKELFSSLDVHIKQISGLADVEILKESDAVDYDLIIMGSKGRRGIRRFFLGDTVSKVGKYAKTSTLVVRGNHPEIRKILVCTAAMSQRGEENVRLAGMIGKAAGAEYIGIVHVMDKIPLLDIKEREGAFFREGAGSTEIAFMEKIPKILEDMGLNGQAKIRYGLVMDEILYEAKEKDYDLIVVGEHSTVGIPKYLVGDIAWGIMEHAKRPVLIKRSRRLGA